jgi:c-di-GMP-binding flagellar brake protein YcgR
MPESNMFIERRAHPRISLGIPVKYMVINDQKKIESVMDRKRNEKVSHTADLSLGGIRLEIDHAVNVGCILRIDMSLPNHSALLSAFAEVMWSDKSSAGLRFLSMKENDAQFLKVFINNALVLKPRDVK